LLLNQPVPSYQGLVGMADDTSVWRGRLVWLGKESRKG